MGIKFQWTNVLEWKEVIKMTKQNYIIISYDEQKQPFLFETAATWERVAEIVEWRVNVGALKFEQIEIFKFEQSFTGKLLDTKDVSNHLKKIRPLS